MVRSAARLPVFSPVRRVLRGGAAAPAWSPLSLFQSGEQGAWYDPTDLTRYTDVSASPELIPAGAGDGSSAAGWSGNNSATVTVSGGRFQFSNAGGFPGMGRLITQPSGMLRVSFDYEMVGASSTIYVNGGGTTATNGVTLASQLVGAGASGRLTFFVTGTPGLRSIEILTNSAAGAFIDNISVREVPLISQATMYQDAAGTTPVTAVEQPVGLILDRRLGAMGALGANIVTNGNFESGLTGWDSVVGAQSVSGGALVLSGDPFAASSQLMTFSVGVTYLVTATVVSPGGPGGRAVVDYRNASAPGAGARIQIANRTTAGEISAVFVPTVASSRIELRCDGVTGASFDNIVVRAVPGNHATQATSASRPVLRNRYNLLGFTEQFDNAAWGNQSTGTVTVTANNATDPLGGNTADTLTGSASGIPQLGAFVSPVIVGASYTMSFWLRADTPSNVTLVVGSVTVGVASLTTSWQRFSYPFVSGFTFAQPAIRLSNNQVINAWGASLVLTSDANLPYQRVGAATDYDSDPAKFPLYLAFDGADDSLATGSVDFSARDEMAVISGVTKLVNRGTIVELSDDANTNNGCFRLGLGSSADSDAAAYTSWSRGTQTSFANSASTFASPHKTVVFSSLDISAPSNVLRVGGAQVATDPATQGAGSFAAAQSLRIGSRSASLRLNGRLHQLIVRGAATPDLAQAEAFVAARMGITL